MESFENIHLDLSKQPGRCKIAEAGLAWKPAGAGDTFTLDSSNIGSAQWSRAARGYEVKIVSRSAGIVQLDGFDVEVTLPPLAFPLQPTDAPPQDFDRVSKVFKLHYGVNLEPREHALRGWNWGKGDFGKAELAFNVQNRPAFEIPYTEIANTNLAGKNEVSVEFALPADSGGGEAAGANGTTGRKAGGGRDQLTELRFYIPGTTTKVVREGGDGSADEEEVEEQNAAALFYETLMDKAEIGDVAGDTYGIFHDILHLTPRFASLVALRSMPLTESQGTLRRGDVRKVISDAREDVRLQGALRVDQEVHATTEAGRDAHAHLPGLGSTATAGSNEVSFLGHAVQNGRGNRMGSEYD